MTRESLTPLTAGLLAAGLLLSPVAWSATATINAAKVTRTLVDSVNFGGCMAYLSISPQTLLPACNQGWVTFSCTGDFNDAVIAYQKLDQAKLALAADMSVNVMVDDSNKHNGYCFARRIDVFK